MCSSDLVALTATVTGSNPTGTVNFTENGSSLSGCSAVALSGSGNGRTAVCTINTLTAGTHSIIASYSGDAGNGASSSSPLSQVVSSAGGSFTNGGFETPSLGSGNFQYAPSGAAWVFTGAAGISGNNSPFTSGNPAAPEGLQVAFLQGGAQIAQSFTLAAGTYTLSLRAAQRGNFNAGTQVIQVAVDGSVVGQYQPPGTSYGSYQTSSFSVAASGTHTLTLAGVGSGSDYTGFVDNVQLASSVSGSTTTTLTSAPNPSTAGALVTFTATVAGSNPTGTVSFTESGASLSGCSSVGLSGSGNSKTAVCSISSLSVGTHVVIASYSGDGSNAASSSAPVSQVVNSASGSFANGGFETPSVGSGNFQHGPSGATWLFTGGAGISGNGSPFTSGNPAAPEGVQVAFLQGAAQIAQSFTISAGTYTLSLRAAQRGNFQSGTQVLQISMDGVLVGQYQPPGTSYGSYQTSSFSVAVSGTRRWLSATTRTTGNRR